MKRNYIGGKPRSGSNHEGHEEHEGKADGRWKIEDRGLKIGDGRSLPGLSSIIHPQFSILCSSCSS
jgi:hypothetical protein